MKNKTMLKKIIYIAFLLIIAITSLSCSQKEELYSGNELNISIDIANDIRRQSGITLEVRGALDENIDLGTYDGHFEEFKDKEKEELIKRHKELENSIIVISTYETDYGEIIWVDRGEDDKLVVKKRYFALGYYPERDGDDIYIDELISIEIPDEVTTISTDKREDSKKIKEKIIKKEYAFLDKMYSRKSTLENIEDLVRKEEIIEIPEYQGTPADVVLEYLSLKALEEFDSPIIKERLEKITSVDLNVNDVLGLHNDFKEFRKDGYVSVEEDVDADTASVIITYSKYYEEYYIEKKDNFTLIKNDYWIIISLDREQEDKEYPKEIKSEKDARKVREIVEKSKSTGNYYKIELYMNDDDYYMEDWKFNNFIIYKKENEDYVKIYGTYEDYSYEEGLYNEENDFENTFKIDDSDGDGEDEIVISMSNAIYNVDLVIEQISGEYVISFSGLLENGAKYKDVNDDGIVELVHSHYGGGGYVSVWTGLELVSEFSETSYEMSYDLTRKYHKDLLEEAENKFEKEPSQEYFHGLINMYANLGMEEELWYFLRKHSKYQNEEIYDHSDYFKGPYENHFDYIRARTTNYKQEWINMISWDSKTPEDVTKTRIQEFESDFLMTINEVTIDLKMPVYQNDLEVMSDEDIDYLIGGIYAKNRYIFSSDKFSTYFSEFDWYNPQYENVEEIMSKYDKEKIRYYLNNKKILELNSQLYNYKNTSAEDYETVDNLFKKIIPSGLTFVDVKRAQWIVNLKERADIFKVYYEGNITDVNEEFLDMRDVFKKSALLLSLISDVDGIRTNISLGENNYNFLVTREMVEKLVGYEFENSLKTVKDFNGFIMELEELNLEKYKYSKEQGETFTSYSYDYEEDGVSKDGVYIINEDLFESVINIMRYEHGIYIDDIKFEGEVLIVNLNKEMEIVFDMGSSGSAAMDLELTYNMLNMKKANKIKILIDGEEDVHGNHFTFEGYKEREHYPDND